MKIYHFINLIKQKHWIISSNQFEAVNNTSWHTPNVCAAVTSDLTLIADTP